MTCDCRDRKISYPQLMLALQRLTGRAPPARPRGTKDRCNYLISEIQDLKRELGRFADRMDAGEQRIEDLRKDAIRALLMGAAAALFEALGPLGKAIRIARRIEGLRGLRSLSRQDLFDLVEALVPLGVTIGALLQYVDDLAEMRQVVNDLEGFEASAEGLRDRMVPLIDEAQAIGCYDNDDFGA